MIRRLVAGPAQGWLSLGLVLLMCLTMAWAIDDVVPVMGRDEYTDFLTWAALSGVLLGFAGPQVGWGRWRTYLIGSIFAALILPLLVGDMLPAGRGSLRAAYEASATSAFNAYDDLVRHGLSFTQEYGHHLIVLGLIVWATSMFATFAVFGHRRPLSAVVIIGVILVIVLSLTRKEELGYLVIYSLASLFLLIRFHALEEQGEWLRRRIGDPSAISGMYLRGGSLFIAVAVVGSLLLTQTARSDPLARAWDGVSASVIDATRSIAKFLPGGPNARSFDARFGDETQIRGFWIGTNEVVATIQMPPNAPTGLFWRANTFDRFDLAGWKSVGAVKLDRPVGSSVLEGSLDAIPGDVATETFTFTVTPAVDDPYLLSPSTPGTVGQATTLLSVGQGGFFAGLVRGASREPYTITAVVPVRDGSQAGGLESNRLREAGRAYPQAVRDVYLQPNQERAMGPFAKALLAEMMAAVPGGTDATPYDIANTMETLFHDPAFNYNTDVQGLPCAEQQLSIVECFAEFKEGYCQYYATTMAIFLREVGVPSRIAEGYLPGERNERTGEETLLARGRHEWVEVYFPGYGWVPFDPTGGSAVPRMGALASGAPPAVSTPRPSSSVRPVSSAAGGRGELDRGPNGTPGASGAARGPSAGLLSAIASLLLIVAASTTFIVWRRGPRGATSPDRAYGTVTRIARRFGYGPRPNQTVYEYAGALGDVLPDARPELETVAKAKVESTYGRASFGAEQLQPLREAERRLRISLLRLVFRRGRRPF